VTGADGHHHEGSEACPVCWKRFKRPFGARLARFFRLGLLEGNTEQSRRLRKRLQRPLSVPVGAADIAAMQAMFATSNGENRERA
jgi:hypothetical protein